MLLCNIYYILLGASKMIEKLDFFTYSLLIGAGATAVMDLWGAFLKHFFNIPSLDYAMVGRWIGHFRQGQFRHAAIAKAERIKGESFIGWAAHYGIGVIFAGLLLSLWGTEWASNPTLLPALLVGLTTVIAPFFLMQPGMGAGIAASKTPAPNTTRLRSLMAHASFGIGLYISALVLKLA